MADPRPLRLGLVIPTLDLGGAEKQLCLLAARLNRSRIEPHVIALTRGGPRQTFLEKANVPVHLIGKNRKLDLPAYRRLSQQISQLKLDVVHTWLFAANCYGRMAAMRNRVPVVLGGERSVDLWKRPYEFWIDRWFAKRTRGLVTNSNGVKDFYASKGIAPEKFFVIPNGIESPGLEQNVNRDLVAETLGIPRDWKWIAAIGRLWPQKNYKEVLWAMELIRVARPDTVLVVFGDGPMRQRLEYYRDQIHIASNVRFVGERADIASLLPSFDLLVNGSLHEGQSNSIMEAMSYGVPVVASDIPGNRDLVLDGETGFLVPQNNPNEMAQKALMLLNDSVKAEKFGSACKQRMQEHFSIDAMVQAHEELYHRLWLETLH